MTARKEIPAHITAKELLAGVADGTYTKAAAKKFLNARVAEKIGLNRKISYATRKACEELGVSIEVDNKELASRRDHADDWRAKREEARKAAALAKEPKAKKPNASAKKPTPEEALAALEAQGVNIADVIAAAYMKAK